jgi:hypothetical protein
LDTQKAVQHPLDINHRCPIEEILNLLQCPFGDRVLHDSGHDANYTLRTLLLIATVDAAAANQPHLEHAQKSLLSAFEEIARGPLNDLQIKRQIEEDRARRRRQKRRAKRLRKRLKQEKGEDMDPDALVLIYKDITRIIDIIDSSLDTRDIDAIGVNGIDDI